MPPHGHPRVWARHRFSRRSRRSRQERSVHPRRAAHTATSLGLAPRRDGRAQVRGGRHRPRGRARRRRGRGPCRGVGAHLVTSVFWSCRPKSRRAGRAGRAPPPRWRARLGREAPVRPTPRAWPSVKNASEFAEVDRVMIARSLEQRQRSSHQGQRMADSISHDGRGAWAKARAASMTCLGRSLPATRVGRVPPDADIRVSAAQSRRPPPARTSTRPAT